MSGACGLKLLRGLVQGLHFVHKTGYFHRDMRLGLQDVAYEIWKLLAGNARVITNPSCAFLMPEEARERVDFRRHGALYLSSCLSLARSLSLSEPWFARGEAGRFRAGTANSSSATVHRLCLDTMVPSSRGFVLRLPLQEGRFCSPLALTARAGFVAKPAP